jgi:hypothetical protein
MPKKPANKTNRSWIIAGIVGIAMLGAAAGARADEGEGHWKHGHRDHRDYGPRYVVVPSPYYAPPRYYAPPPRYYAPPVVYAPAYPVYAAPAYPVYDAPYQPPGVNLNFNIPLR